MQEIWYFDFQRAPEIICQTTIMANDKTLVFESNSYDPDIIYDNLKTPIFENGFLYANVSSQNSGIFELFFDYGNGIDYSNSVKFLLLGGNESRDFLLFTVTIQKTAERAEARREKQHVSAPLCVLCGESFLPRSIYPE